MVCEPIHLPSVCRFVTVWRMTKEWIGRLRSVAYRPAGSGQLSRACLLPVEAKDGALAAAQHRARAVA
jgi:hypothetical protein